VAPQRNITEVQSIGCDCDRGDQARTGDAAKDHIAGAGIGASIRVGPGCADHDVVEAVAVDIATTADGPARVIDDLFAVDPEADVSVHLGQRDNGGKALRRRAIGNPDCQRPCQYGRDGEGQAVPLRRYAPASGESCNGPTVDSIVFGRVHEWLQQIVVSGGKQHGCRCGIGRLVATS